MSEFFRLPRTSRTLKQRLKGLIFLVAYYVGIDSLFYWLNRRAKRIVVFHNVIPDALAVDLPDGIVGMKYSHFTRIIDECAQKFSFSTDILDACTLTITFDDGYRNQYSVAFKYLQSRGIPAILFFSPGTREVLTIDKMVFWRELVSKEYVPGGDMGRFWRDQFWPRYMADGTTRGKATLEWLESFYPLKPLMVKLSDDFIRERLGAISDEELEEMRGAGWLIGWHTKTHVPLAVLSENELNDELDAPEIFRFVPFAYPYGTDACVDARARRAVEAHGFPCALSYSNASPNNALRFFLSRIPSVSADFYELHAQLSGVSYFLSYRKLLPVVEPPGGDQ